MQNDTRVQYTRHVFGEALVRLLGEKPIGKITVKELCAAAGLSRGTFYLHYGEPLDVLKEVEESAFQEQAQFIEAYWQDHPKGNVLEMTLRVMQKKREMFLVLSGPHGRPEFVERVFGTAKEVVVDEWNKEYPSYHRQDIAFVYDYIIKGNNAIILKWLENPERLSPADVSRRLETLARHCLLAIAEF